MSTFDYVGHGLSVGDPIYWGNLDPEDCGIIDGQTYYVLTTPTADTFTISETDGGPEFDLTFDLIAGDLTPATAVYSLIADPDDVMAPPVEPDAPVDLTVTSVVHNDTVVLRVTAPSAAEATVRSVQVQVTKAVVIPDEPTIVQSSQGDIGPATPASLSVAATDGNLVVILTTGSSLPTGFTSVFPAYADVAFAPGNVGYLLGVKIAASETNSYLANTGEYIMAEFSGIGATPLDPQPTTNNAAAARMHKAFNPSSSESILILGTFIRDAWNSFTAVPDAGYTLAQKNESNSNNWATAIIWKAEASGGAYDPGISTSSGDGNWGAGVVAFEASATTEIDWDKAMEHTLVEDGSDRQFDIPVLGSTAYALRSRRQDVYGNFGDWSPVSIHTSTAGADGLVAKNADNHINDTDDAHDASAISILDTANDFTATDVEGALAELQSDAEAHSAAADPHPGYLTPAEGDAAYEPIGHAGDPSDAHEASAITVVPFGSIAATDVQAALEEIVAEATGGGGIPATIVDAQGDLIAATAADTVTRVPVGVNGKVLIADSGETAGVKWTDDLLLLNDVAAASLTSSGDVSGDVGAFDVLVATTVQGGNITFPGSPTTDDRFYRTDLGMWFYYDGTRWLSTQIFETSAAQWGPNDTFLATITTSRTAAQRAIISPLLGSDIWLVSAHAVAFVGAGTALSGSHKWVATFNKHTAAAAATSLGTAAIDSGASSNWRRADLTIGALLGTTYLILDVDWAKTGTPGNLTIAPPFVVRYRVVAT